MGLQPLADVEYMRPFCFGGGGARRVFERVDARAVRLPGGKLLAESHQGGRCVPYWPLSIPFTFASTLPVCGEGRWRGAAIPLAEGGESAR